jgi:hypothetical protein
MVRTQSKQERSLKKRISRRRRRRRRRRKKIKYRSMQRGASTVDWL